MAVDHVDALKAMPCQREHDVVQHRQQGRGLQAHRAGKAQMVLRHAEGLRRGHQHAGTAAHLQGHRLGGEGIGADRPGGTVLLG